MSLRPQSRLDPYSLTKEPQVSYLLELVIKDAAHNLEEEIVAAIRPRIRAHVEKAMQDLQPRLEAAMNPFERELAFRLTVNELPPRGE